MGHRRGLGYEAEVYQSVLRFIGLSKPRFYGAYTEPFTGRKWLVLQYISRSSRAHKSTAAPSAMIMAVRWIGQFHARAEKLMSRGAPPFLVTHDADYYRKWVRRTAIFATRVEDQFPWLAVVCRQAEVQ